MHSTQTQVWERGPGGPGATTVAPEPWWVRWFWWLLVGLTVLRLVYLATAPIDLSGDEAQYWDWSRRPALSYYSKPPGVAYLIWVSTHALGSTAFAVRVWAPLFLLGASGLLYRLGRELFDARTGAAAGLLLQGTPMFGLWCMGMIPDTPLLFFWTAGLYALHRAVQTGRWRWWLTLTGALGLAWLCKFAIVFFLAPMFLYLGGTASGRLRLRGAGPYVAVGLSLVFLAPPLIWNAQHDWVTLQHDLGHVRGGGGWVLDPLSLLEFAGGQLGVMTPLLGAMAVVALWKLRRQAPLLFWFGVPLLAGFAVKSLFGKVQPNWPLTAQVTGVVAFCGYYLRDRARFGRHGRRLISAAVIVAAVGTVVAHYPMVLTELGLPRKLDPSRRLRGYQELGQALGRLQADMGPECFIFSDKYQVTALTAFYTPGQPTTYCVNLGRRRMNQYDLWPGFEGRLGDDALFVTWDRKKLPERLDAAFTRWALQPVQVRDWRGRLVREFAVFQCYDFRGMAPVEPARH